MPPKRSTIVSAYTDRKTPGAFGGVDQYASVQGLTWKEALDELRGQLAYTLHHPICRRFPTLPVLVFHLDEQWVADPAEIQPLKR